MKKALLVVTVVMITSAFAALPALALKPPVITLERVEVATIQPFYVKPKIAVPSKENPKKKVDKVKTYGYSSTLNTAYILNIKNPNKKPIMLDELSFTVAFEGFDVNTVTAYEDSWIPGGKTNQVRVIATNEAFPTIVSLKVGAMNVKRIQDMKTSAGAMVGKWWKTISDFSFPITLSNGTALFRDEKGKEMRVTFSGKFGKAAAAKKEKAGSGKK
jgi:archaellum component FlaG (FlaF/FlaG flagellin family)